MPRLSAEGDNVPATLTRNPTLIAMNVEDEVRHILDEVLSLGGRTKSFARNTPLLGAVPELDSMAVVALITTIEDRFGIVVNDDAIDGSTFATLGSLSDFVDSMLAA